MRLNLDEVISRFSAKSNNAVKNQLTTLGQDPALAFACLTPYITISPALSQVVVAKTVSALAQDQQLALASELSGAYVHADEEGDPTGEEIAAAMNGDLVYTALAEIRQRTGIGYIPVGKLGVYIDLHYPEETENGVARAAYAMAVESSSYVLDIADLHKVNDAVRHGIMLEQLTAVPVIATVNQEV